MKNRYFTAESCKCVWMGVESTSPDQKANHLVVPSHLPSGDNRLPSTKRAAMRPSRDPPSSMTHQRHPGSSSPWPCVLCCGHMRAARVQETYDPRGCDSRGHGPTLLADAPFCFWAESPMETNIIMCYFVFVTRGALSVKTTFMLMGTEWIFLFPWRGNK